jgi:LysM repeat protein
MRTIKVFVAVVALFVTAAFTTTASAKEQTSQYTVAPGDNLSRLANRFDTSVAGILKDNPKIANPNLIYPGENLTIPGKPVEETMVSLSPQSGAPGASVQVVGEGLPANTSVKVELGLQGGQLSKVASLGTDANGTLSTQVAIPRSATTGEKWVVLVDASSGTQDIQGTSLPFTVTNSSETHGQTNYIVKPGDYLTRIAARYGVSLAAILKANPEITNPNLIYPGEALVIPGGGKLEPTVVIYQSSDHPETRIEVSVAGFPANSLVGISLGKLGSPLAQVAASQTDPQGSLNIQVSLPKEANLENNETYIAVVNTLSGSQVEAISNQYTAPESSETHAGLYLVKPGDNLSAIANHLGTSVAAILKDNPKINNPRWIYPGEQLLIPENTTA